jgi:3-hydroxybutyrate dehydrogenase
MLQGKVAVVTGSTSGIGLGIAKSLAAAGAHVVLNGLADAKAVTEAKRAVRGSRKVKVLYHAADMSKPSEVTDLIDYARRELGSVDILVNNAGIQHTAPVDSFPADKWDAIIAINLSSAFHAIRAALPLMKKRKWGRIINVASVHGLVASTDKIAYVAAKHGIVGVTKVVALETAETGITCNAICPGWVLTPLVERQIEAIAKRDKLSIAKASVRLLEEKQPSKRFTGVEQIGETVLFFCSDAASNTTGVSLPVDGGWVAR